VGANNEVSRPLPLEGTTKEDIMWMVEATAMVYKVMEEQHKVDSLVPKEPTILKNAMLCQWICFAIMPHPWHTRTWHERTSR
jgi:hypothetical protein